MAELQLGREDRLYQRVVEILEEARAHVSRTVNTAMVVAYWLVGREIVEVEQGGQERADYGDALLQGLARRLAARFGKGFSFPNVKRMRQFYLAFPKGSALVEGRAKSSTPSSRRQPNKSSTLSSQSLVFPPTLSWSHYLVLMKVEAKLARSFYEVEASREAWSVREMERQVASQLFERLAKSRRPSEVRTLARDGQAIAAPSDVLKDPFVLEFLDLDERAAWQERDLEQAIIDRLQDFLLELGKGFCFVARQRRLSLDGDHFYVDLVFYNRLLGCFVLVDLKLGKLTHQDLGQMTMYVNWFDRFQKQEHEAPTIGIVLCSEKNDAMVKITLPEGNEQILAARYQLYLPSEDELRAALFKGRAHAERDLERRAPHTAAAAPPAPTSSAAGSSAHPG